MPRSGPRPYECVKRAWHSERHQPMRGLIIQHIFRLVQDNHSAVTKKNREWQEKLPVVVLKAEEIMYSKANSEAEYLNLETVWDRVNDAIDTIIRRDESTETGELLPPCVEAALNLGCVPVKAARSQRLNNPRTYLRPHYQESPDVSPKVTNQNCNDVHSFPLVHLSTSSISPMANIPRNVDSRSPHLVWEPNNCNFTSNAKNQVAVSSRSYPHTCNKNNTEVERISSSSRGSVYPLYYGTSFVSDAKKFDSIIVGVPIYTSSVPEPAKVRFLQNLFPLNNHENVTQESEAASLRDNNKGKELEKTCDLSLRLGVVVSDTNTSREREYDCEMNSVDLRGLKENRHHRQEEFCFFPASEEDQDRELVSRKNCNLSDNVDLESDDHLFWSQDPLLNQFASRSRRPDL